MQWAIAAGSPEKGTFWKAMVVDNANRLDGNVVEKLGSAWRCPQSKRRQQKDFGYFGHWRPLPTAPTCACTCTCALSLPPLSSSNSSVLPGTSLSIEPDQLRRHRGYLASCSSIACLVAALFVADLLFVNENGWVPLHLRRRNRNNSEAMDQSRCRDLDCALYRGHEVSQPYEHWQSLLRMTSRGRSPPRSRHYPAGRWAVVDTNAGIYYFLTRCSLASGMSARFGCCCVNCQCVKKREPFHWPRL